MCRTSKTSFPRTRRAIVLEWGWPKRVKKTSAAKQWRTALDIPHLVVLNDASEEFDKDTSRVPYSGWKLIALYKNVKACLAQRLWLRCHGTKYRSTSSPIAWSGSSVVQKGLKTVINNRTCNIWQRTGRNEFKLNDAIYLAWRRSTELFGPELLQHMLRSILEL